MFYAGIKIFNSLPSSILILIEIINSRLHYKNTLLLILFIRLLNFSCITGMSLKAVIYSLNLYLVIYGV